MATALATPAPARAHGADPGALRVALSYPRHGVTVFTGEGELVRTWGPVVTREEETSLERTGYYVPDMHPAADRLVCLKCRERLTRISRDDVLTLDRIACSLVLLFIEGARQTVLHDIPPIELPHARVHKSPGGIRFDAVHDARPVERPSAAHYSPDGQRIAFYEAGAVVIVEATTGEESSRTPIHDPARPIPPEHDAGFELWGDIEGTGGMRWSPDGKRLYLLSAHVPGPELREPLPEAMSPPSCLAQIDVATGRLTWLNLYLPWILDEKSGLVTYTEVRDGEWRHVEGHFPDTEAIAALFGSAAYPVSEPIHSADRRSYFFVWRGEGFFWKEALMRYDVERGKVKTLQVFHRGLYRE